MNTLNDLILPLALKLLGLGVAAGLLWLIPKIEKRFPKQPLIAHGLEVLAAAAAQVVPALAQTMVADAKRDGKWTPQMAADVKAKAISELKDIGAQGVEMVAAGGMTPATIDKALDHIVEKAVGAAKATVSTTTVAVTATTPALTPVGS